MIIETSANHLYFVVDTTDEHLSHCWNGLRAKRVKGGFMVVKNAKPELVRKAGCRKIADFSELKGAA